MEFYINTIREKQYTIENLPPAIMSKTWLVTDKKTSKVLPWKYSRVIILPDDIVGLSAARQWTMEQANSNLLMFMDDDLQFHIRYDGLKLRKPTDAELEEMFYTLEDWLFEYDDIALVGISPRAGNNRCTADYEENTRIMRCYGFKRDILMKEGIRWDRLELKQDFDVTLGLLTKGYKNRLLYTFCNGELGGANAAGGCSTYRTPEMMTKVAHELQRLYPDVVNVVQKKSKTGWPGMPKLADGTTLRTEVVVQWKKAYRPKPATKGITSFL